MINDIKYLPLVTGELFLITLILLIYIIICYKKQKKLEKEIEELHKEKKDWLKDKSKLILIDSRMREYKETNKNPFTVLRDIRNLLWKKEETK